MTALLTVVLSAVLAYQAPPPVKAAPQTLSPATPVPTKAAAAPKRTPARSSPAPASSGISDAELEKAIRARLAASKISSNRFAVHVQGGVAYLEGSTGVLQHKGTATRLAKNCGAVKVVNKIQVSDEAKEKAAGNLSSGRRRAQVKRGDSPGKRSESPGRT